MVQPYLLLLLLLLLLTLFSYITNAIPVSTSHSLISSSCKDIDFCREVFSDGYCDRECWDEECGYDGGDCQSINSFPGQIILNLHVTPSTFMKVQKDVVYEISTVSDAIVSLARDKENHLLIWAWSPTNGPYLRIDPENNQTDLSTVTGIEVLFDVYPGGIVPDCISNCELEIARSIDRFNQGIKNNELSDALTAMINGDEWSTSNQDYNMTKIVMIIIVSSCIIIGVYGVIVQNRKRKVIDAPVWKIPIRGQRPMRVNDAKRQRIYEWIENGIGHTTVIHSLIASRQTGSELLIEEAIMNGVDINQCDEEGRSVFHIALHHLKSTRFIHWLISKGADPTVCDYNDRTVLHVAVTNYDAPSLSALLEYESVKTQINNHDYRNMTPLKLASSQGSVDLIRELIEHGADVNYQGPEVYGSTEVQRGPIHFAIMNGHKEAANYLIQHGVRPNIPDSRGRTPLHYAAMYSDVQMCISLIEFSQAAIDLVDDENMSAEEVATLKMRYENAQYLSSINGHKYEEEKKKRIKSKKEYSRRSNDTGYGSGANSSTENLLSPPRPSFPEYNAHNMDQMMYPYGIFPQSPYTQDNFTYEYY